METGRRNEYVTTAMVFVVFLGFAFVLPFLPLYVRELGVADEARAAMWAGALIGIAPLIAGALAPVWGRLADRHGHKKMAVWALVSYVVILSLSAVVRNVWELLALRAGIGIFGAIGPLGLAMATAGAPREQTGRAVGLVQAAQILSAAAGPFLGGLLADSIGTRATFVVTAGLCAAALVLVWSLYEDGQPPASTTKRPVDGVRILTRPVWALLVVLFLVNFVGRSFTPILPLYLHLLGVPLERLASSTGVLISLYSVAAAASATLLGRASRHRSPRLLLVLSLAGGALLVIAMGLASSYPSLLVLGTLLGLVSGGALTLCYTIGGLLASGERRATAFGYFSAAALFGGAISPSVAGLAAYWQARTIFFVDAAIFALLAVVLLRGARGDSPAGDPTLASGAS